MTESLKSSEYMHRAGDAAKKAGKKAAEVGLDLGKKAVIKTGEVGLDLAKAGTRKVVRHVKEHPKGTALGMAVLALMMQDGHISNDNDRFVERTVDASVADDDWVAEVNKFATVKIDAIHGETFYALAKNILSTESVWIEANSIQRAGMIDAVILATREMNPDSDLDNFSSILGEELAIPTEFTWRAKEESALNASGDYIVLQDYAKSDGYDVAGRSHQDIYDDVFKYTVTVAESGDGFELNREGSEDSEARLFPEVVESIEGLGGTFSTLEMGSGGAGWKFVLTDMLRDEQTQRRRGSLKKGSTHSTGRSFDVSDGRWISPDGKEITWSEFDEHGRGIGKGEDADFIDDELRPAFEQVAIDQGWVLFKEPGHWHVYVPKKHFLDLTDEWKGYAGLSRPEKKKKVKKDKREKKDQFRGERVSLSFEIGEELLETYDLNEQNRIEYSELKSERDDLKRKLKGGTFIHQLKTHGTYYDEVVDQISRAQPEDLGRLGYFKFTTLHKGNHPMSNIEAAWKWKTKHRLKKGVKRFGEHVEPRVGDLAHEFDFSSWYEQTAALQAEVIEHADDLMALKAGKNPEAAREMVKYITPEVMLAAIHAEFFSEIPGESFVDVMPRLFDGYNIMQGPALNDSHFSSGPMQLIYPTFKGMLSKYGREVSDLQENDGAFSGVIVPKKVSGEYSTDEIANAMVLDKESVAFWSYMSAVYHTELAFNTMMSDKRFAKSWKKASDADKLRFMAAFVPVANHVGRGGAQSEASELLRSYGSKSIADMALSLQDIKMKPTAKRSARVGLESMDVMIDLVD